MNFTNATVCCQVLFELARYHAPATIFLDEVDALMAVRGGEGEHEASRRMKTEFLIQMDGLAQSSAHVFVLAATNLPWHLDSVSAQGCLISYNSNVTIALTKSTRR